MKKLIECLEEVERVNVMFEKKEKEKELKGSHPKKKSVSVWFFSKSP